MVTLTVQGTTYEEIRASLAGMFAVRNGATPDTAADPVIERNEKPVESAEKKSAGRPKKTTEPAPGPTSGGAAAAAPVASPPASVPAAPAAPADIPLTLEGVKGVLQQVAAKAKTADEGMLLVGGIVQKIAGCQRIREIPLDKYGAVIAEAQRVLAA